MEVVQLDEVATVLLALLLEVVDIVAVLVMIEGVALVLEVVLLDEVVAVLLVLLLEAVDTVNALVMIEEVSEASLSWMTAVVRPMGSTSPAVITGETIRRTADIPEGSFHDRSTVYMSVSQLQ